MDYYTRIEQGRETAPSDAVLDALAASLRLTADENDHMLAVADRVAGRTSRRAVNPEGLGLLPGLGEDRPRAGT